MKIIQKRQTIVWLKNYLLPCCPETILKRCSGEIHLEVGRTVENLHLQATTLHGSHTDWPPSLICFPRRVCRDFLHYRWREITRADKTTPLGFKLANKRNDKALLINVELSSSLFPCDSERENIVPGITTRGLLDSLLANHLVPRLSGGSIVTKSGKGPENEHVWNAS